MAQDTTPAIVCYQGDGSNNVFSVPFDKGYYGDVKVLFVRRGLADYTYYPTTYTVSGRLYAWAYNTTIVYTHTPTPSVGAPTYDSSDVEQIASISVKDTNNITTVYTRASANDIPLQGLYAWKNGTTFIYTKTKVPNIAAGNNVYNAQGTILPLTIVVVTGVLITAIAGQTITAGGVTYTRAQQHDHKDNLLLTWTGTTLQVGDFICIVRDTERGQPYEMPNNQKHIERALDNIERQVQEVKDATDNALKIDPSHNIPDSHKMNPIDWLKSIIRCMDFSVRAVRFANGWFDYSLDDPNIADGSKTWYHLLNTDNIKSIRERREIIDNEEHYWVEYLTYDNEWRKLVDSAWEDRIDAVELVASEAHNIAENALNIAGQANTKADTAVDYATAAQQAVSGIACRKYIFTLSVGQNTVVIGEEAEVDNIDLYLNGQLLIPTGNWSVSGDTISLLFGPEAGDVVVVIVGTIRQIATMISMDAHNADPLAHSILFNHIDCGVL